MLHEIYIKDYALIEEMRIQFISGLNIITGETGAGKSIIIGALGLLLGERSNVDTIREGAEKTVVEGLFDIPESYPNDHHTGFNGFDIQKEILIRREVHKTGRSRCFLNDTPISLTQLNQIGDLLVDLHGQHAHQTLLKTDLHIDYLDNFGVEPTLLNKVKEIFKKYHNLTKQLAVLSQNENESQEKRELLEFQVKEISKINPQVNEEAALEKEEKLLKNCEELFQAAKSINTILYEGDTSVVEMLGRTENTIERLIEIDTIFEKWKQDIESTRITIEEMINSFQSYVSKIEFDPERLEWIRERLGLFSHLKKKYGGSIDSVIQYKIESEKKLNQIENLSEEIDSLTILIQQENTNLKNLCQTLSDMRKEVAKDLEDGIVAALKDLGLKDAIFKIRLSIQDKENGFIEIDHKKILVNAKGMDSIEFLISTNPGEPPKPLVQVASGGEISRIMLALKSVLAEADKIPVLIFDEIDTGISGRIARVVGKNLKDLSKNHQVICITHLPQIASLADGHFCVEKEITKKRSYTLIRKLDQEERVNEIAKLLGGEKVTETTIKGAKELLSECSD